MNGKKLKKFLKELNQIKEDGVGGISSAPTNVTGVNIAGTTPETVGVSVGISTIKKRKSDFPKSPIMSGIYKRKPPKI